IVLLGMISMARLRVVESLRKCENIGTSPLAPQSMQKFWWVWNSLVRKPILTLYSRDFNPPPGHHNQTIANCNARDVNRSATDADANDVRAHNGFEQFRQSRKLWSMHSA